MTSKTHAHPGHLTGIQAGLGQHGLKRFHRAIQDLVGGLAGMSFGDMACQYPG